MPEHPTTPIVPDDLALEQNEADLAEHERELTGRIGFTCTVVGPALDHVAGRVHPYPTEREGSDVDVRCWVREDKAELDKPLCPTVLDWSTAGWPLTCVDYAAR